MMYNDREKNKFRILLLHFYIRCVAYGSNVVSFQEKVADVSKEQTNNKKHVHTIYVIVKGVTI
jgi:hypothetical protein